MQAQDRLHWSTEQGEVIEKDGIRITPESRSLTIRWPNGGLVWNRPLAVVVDRGGTTERIPIVDVTAGLCGEQQALPPWCSCWVEFCQGGSDDGIGNGK